MADNVAVTPGSGATIATDDVGGVQYQRVKVAWGTDGTANDASASNPLPVTQASAPLPTGAATAAKQPALGTAGTASSDVLTVQGIASMTALKVDGSAVTQPVSISGSVAVTGTFWQATQPVSAASLPLPSGAATSAKQDSVISALGSPFQAGGSIGNASFGISGTLPAFAAIPAVKLDQTTPGTTNGVVLTGDLAGSSYETVAASQTDQVMGATGATGDFLSGVLIVPGTTAAGSVSVKDGSGSSITIFAGGGTTALTTLIPFFVPFGAKSTGGAWKVTTGANVTAVGFGKFT